MENGERVGAGSIRELSDLSQGIRQSRRSNVELPSGKQHRDQGFRACSTGRRHWVPDRL